MSPKNNENKSKSDQGKGTRGSGEGNQKQGNYGAKLRDKLKRKESIPHIKVYPDIKILGVKDSKVKDRGRP